MVTTSEMALGVTAVFLTLLIDGGILKTADISVYSWVLVWT